MKLKGLVDYDIVNYRLPSMFLIFPKCSFKCDVECGRPICQNSALAHEEEIEVDTFQLISRYLQNPLTHAVVCGGLEPFDTPVDLYTFITLFRAFSKDTIVIYTGYTEKELSNEIPRLQQFDNIIVKYGRFIPDSPHIFDAVLGVELASMNQYAKLLTRSDSNEYPTIDRGENQMEKQQSDY